MKYSYDLAIIGGGAAGLMAAISAKANLPTDKKDFSICVLEKNTIVGKKILLTGKGRCNFTNTADKEDFIEAFGKNGKFLYHAFNTFSNYDLISFFEDRGVPTKIERGGRVFPENDKAISILNSLRKQVRKDKTKIFYRFPVVKITKSQKEFRIMSSSSQVITAKKLIIATGGKSYEITGSTGDGHSYAEDFGHTIEKTRPGLAPLYVKNELIRSLAGLDLKNVQLRIFKGEEEIYKKIGTVLFTHQGISGPIVLPSSKLVHKAIAEKENIVAMIDLKPTIEERQIIKRLESLIRESAEKEYQSLLKELLPRSLIPVFIKVSGYDKHRKNKTFNSQNIKKIAALLKNFSFYIDGVAPIEKAIVTAGGVNLKEIDPNTMESKLVSNLHFAGEIINVDGITGGYNLTAAFSTGWLAGKSVVLQ